MDKNYDLHYNQQLRATQLVYHEKCSTDVFKESHEKMFELYRSLDCYKHITDTRKMGVVAVDIQKWVAREIVSKMVHNSKGKAYVGLVLGADIFATVAAKNIERNSDDTGLVTAYFQTWEEAEEWIKQQ